MNVNYSHPQNFSALTPDCVLNALESVGFRSDGRLLALNSYENRVYQIGMEQGAPLVAKFYRPARWPDAAILEEHAFVQELAEHEIPVVPALAMGWGDAAWLRGLSLRGFSQTGRACAGTGRPPHAGMDGPISRPHPCRRELSTFRHRPSLDIESFGEEPRDYLLAARFIPDDIEAAYRSVVEQALDGVRSCFKRAGDVANIRLHGDCHAGNVLWTR